MPLESFYGGKQGVSPIVKARFEYVTNATDAITGKYIDEAYGRAVASAEKENDASLLKSINKETMECCFADPNYTDVWYGELAIINTKNKRNPNNGKLFRRTLNGAVNNEDGVSHAEYIGTIVGPSEGFPFIEIAGSTEKLKEKVSSITDIDQQSEGFQYGYPTGEGTRAVTYEFNNDDDTPLFEYEANVEGKSLVPGARKNSNGEWTSYEKGIKYSWVNVRNNIDGTEQDTYVYLGFKIPYTIFDFNFDTKPWNYTGEIAEFLNEKNYLGIKPTNDNTWESTPFYQKWRIHLLRGKPGNQVGYLRRVKANTFCNFDTTKNVNSNGKPKNPILYSYNSIFNTNNTKAVEDFVLTPPNVVWSNSAWRVGNISISSEDYLGEEVNAESDIIVYTVYAIDKNSSSLNGISQFDCYLGKTKDIKGIVLNEDGTLNINYSDATSVKLENKIKWIKSINTTPRILKDNNVISGLSVTYNTITKDINGNDVNDSDFFIVPYVHDMRVGLVSNSSNNNNPEFNIQYTKVDSKLENNELTPYITSAQTLKEGWNTSNPQDFKFSFLKSLKIDADTQELVYATSPARHKFKNEDMPFNDWANNTNDEYWTKFGTSGVYLNNIDKVTIFNGYLYVLYSSSKYRYDPYANNAIVYEESIVEKYVTYYGKFTIDPTGLKWKCSSAPSFKPNKVVGNWDDLWWVELGRIEQPKNGVWVSTEFDKERFVKYFNTKFPNKVVSSWNDFSFTSDYNAVLDIMNGKWPTRGSIDNVDIDGGWTITVNDKSIETNPYKDGHIYLYEKAARDDNNEIDLTLSPNNDQTGNLVKNGDNYFYFDYNWRMWRLAGTFTSGISGGGGSGNAEWPIFISTIKGSQNYLIPPKKDANIDENSLILIESEFLVQESYLDNIF